ncbi:MAG: Omp28-related outer membrane protein [Saprospiraceae bacterium]
MKKLTFLFVIVSMVVFSSCKKNEVETIKLVVTDFSKKVLVENFMGVQCIACPLANDELENLIDIHGDDLIVVSLHPDDFGTPHSSSQHDFRTTEVEEVTEYLGRPAAYPSAVINRKDLDGGDYYLPTPKTLWAGYIQQELEATPKLSVNISKNYDSITRELSVQVSGMAQEDIIGDLNLSIIITETNIADPQIVLNEGIVEDYVHKHVFRTSMTESTGDLLVTNLLTGDNYEENYLMILPEDWNAENCKVVAFVSLIEGQNKEVMQTESKKIED